MTAPLPDAIDTRLDRMLAGMEWELQRSRRSRVTDGATATLLRDAAGFVFLHDGRASVRTTTGCWTAVAAGDLVLVPRPGDLTFRGEDGAGLAAVVFAGPDPAEGDRRDGVSATGAQPPRRICSSIAL